MPATKSRFVSRLAYSVHATRAIAAQPYEGIERARERVAEWRDSRRPPPRYEPVDNWEQRVHELIGTHWPCDERSEFVEIWRATMDDLADRGLRVGRGAFGGWDDGDSRLVETAWCLARHLRPKRCVETGVARGLTTRTLLEALERNDDGHLWSVDLPPLLERDLSDETGAAVPRSLYERWTLLRGSSRRVLPGLTAELGQVDLFVHDSMHTARNVSFELEQVWQALAPGGVVLIDDVEKNVATSRFLKAHPDTPAVIFASEDGNVLVGCLMKPRTDGRAGSEA